MRSLKLITSDLKEVSGKKQSLEHNLRQRKRKITNPYDVRQLIYGVMIFALPLAVWLSWIFFLNTSWYNNALYQKIIIIILIPVVSLGLSVFFVFVCITLVADLKKRFNPYYLLSYYFFSKATHERMRRIESNDFSNEPELVHLSAELEEKKQTYEALKVEYETAEQEFHQRAQAFIESCEDEEVREELNQLFLNKQKKCNDVQQE
jgi:hypothetical protein